MRFYQYYKTKMEGINQVYFKNQIERVFNSAPQLTFHISGIISKVKVEKESCSQLSILAPQFHLLNLIESLNTKLNAATTHITNFQFEYKIQSEYLLLEIDVLVNNCISTYAECYTYTDDNRLVNKSTIIYNKTFQE